MSSLLPLILAPRNPESLSSSPLRILHTSFEVLGNTEFLNRADGEGGILWSGQ